MEQQDISFGDIGSNLVNTDPTKPWVKIVEADGNDALLRAHDYGSSGDTFTTGDRFGHTGHQIWDNRGRLVPWTITVTSLSDESSTIAYDFVGDPDSTIELPRNPIVLLPNEIAQAVFYSDISCDFTTELSNQPQIQTESDGAYVLEILNLSGISTAKGEITGTLGCDDRPMTHVSLDWNVVNHRLSTEALEATVPWNEPSIVEFYPESIGDGPRIYTITVDGPAGRISESVTSGTYLPGEPIVLTIDPDGLLEPRMIARGELVIVDSDNIEQRIPIVLNSDGELPFGPFNWLAIPSNAISTVLVLLAFSVATGGRKFSADSEKSL